MANHGWFIMRFWYSYELTYKPVNRYLTEELVMAPHNDERCDADIIRAYDRQGIFTVERGYDVTFPSYFWDDYFVQHKTFSASSRLLHTVNNSTACCYCSSLLILCLVALIPAIFVGLLYWLQPARAGP